MPNQKEHLSPALFISEPPAVRGGEFAWKVKERWRCSVPAMVLCIPLAAGYLCGGALLCLHSGRQSPAPSKRRSLSPPAGLREVAFPWGAALLNAPGADAEGCGLGRLRHRFTCPPAPLLTASVPGRGRGSGNELRAVSPARTAAQRAGPGPAPPRPLCCPEAARPARGFYLPEQPEDVHGVLPLVFSDGGLNLPQPPHPPHVGSGRGFPQHPGQLLRI